MTGFEHRVPLGDTGWWVWRDVMLRSAGFAAEGLTRFAAPAAASAADALLAGEGDADHFDKELADAVAEGAGVASRLAAEPLLREAVTWQNHRALTALDGLAAGGRDAPRNVRRRDRERVLIRYWQRYCGKNETIGFFGPVVWGRLAESDLRVDAVAGQGLVRRRRVWFESWALRALGDVLASDPAIRRWFPPALAPHLTLAGRHVVRPVRPPVPVSAIEAAALAACDGRRPAVEVVGSLLADADSGLRSEDDGYLLLDRLVERELLNWDAALPDGMDVEPVLRARLEAIGEPAARRRAVGDLDRLVAARDEVAAAAGDPAALRTALVALDAVFGELTGLAASRGAGRAYAGRTVCFEDTTRDLDVTIGTRLLDDLAEPLAIMLRSARWLTAALGDAVDRVLHELVAELAAGGEPVRLADAWYLAQGQLFTGDGPVPPLLAEFGRRWSALLGIDRATGGRLDIRVEDLDGRAFDADGPGWASARLHSVDLQLCAPSIEAINGGDYLAVLGELHPAMPVFDTAAFAYWHPDPSRLRAARDADVGRSVVVPLFPDDYPRQNSRTGFGLTAPGDVQLGIDASRCADHSRLLPATAAVVARRRDELVVLAPDGRSWPLLTVFADMLSQQLMDGFKLLDTGRPHSPRVTIGRLVVARQTWRTTVEQTRLADVIGEPDRYLAVRRWCGRLSLPDRVFVRIATEPKPCYFDLTGPAYVQALCTMLRTARAEAGGEVAVTVSEALPGPVQTWLPDAAGRTYSSELRLQLTDPARHRSQDPGAST